MLKKLRKKYFPTEEEIEEARETEWHDKNTSTSADNIRDYFHGLEYIVELDWEKVYASGWILLKDIRIKYCYPSRQLEDQTIFTCVRGTPTNDSRIFALNEIFGGDRVFAATNNEKDAIMLALKYK